MNAFYQSAIIGAALTRWARRIGNPRERGQHRRGGQRRRPLDQAPVGHEAAGTTTLLEGPGPFTVFAPNDDAFAKVPADKLDKLMRPGMRTMLTVTLANHVVTGLVDQAALDKALAQSGSVMVLAANTVPLIFKKDVGGLTVNGAHIIKGL